MEDSPMPRSPPDEKRKRQPPNKRQLNNLLLKSLQAERPAVPFLIWDTKQDRLAVRVETSGFTSYKFIYSRHGRPRWFNVGSVKKIGLQDARDICKTLAVEVAAGKDPQANKTAVLSNGTFEELASLYRAHAKKKNKSWQSTDDLVQKHLVKPWGKKQAASIVRKDVKHMMARIEETPILANQVLASASAIFTWAIKEELSDIKINPCSMIDRNSTKTAKSDRKLSDSEIPKFWTAFENDVGLVEGLALKMILLTGQRAGEVRYMRSEHIGADGWWQMPGAPDTKLNWPGTKNGQTHSVFLPTAAQQIIKGLDRTGMLFAGARGTVPVNGLDRDMRDICKTLGIENRATPHDLRRTHSSAVAKLFSRDAMNRITNHKEGGIGDIYDAADYADENKKIMETVAAKFMALIDGGDGAANFGKAV
jgi:integrase